MLHSRKVGTAHPGCWWLSWLEWGWTRQWRVPSSSSVPTCAQHKQDWQSWTRTRFLGQNSPWVHMQGAAMGRLEGYVLLLLCTSSPAWSTGWSSSCGTRNQPRCMKHCHSPPWSLQLSPFHSQGPHVQWDKRVGGLRSFRSSLDSPALVISGLYGRSTRPPVRTCCGMTTQGTLGLQDKAEVTAGTCCFV